MKKEPDDYIIRVDLREQTPEMLIERKENEPLYERTFYLCESETDAEFDQNTTTWD